MLDRAMTRLSISRLAGLTLVAAAFWIGCVGRTEPPPVPICTQYCDALNLNCNGLEYKDQDECLKVCALMDEGAEGVIDDTAGCRLGFAKQARNKDEAACKKASAFGGAACGDPCTTFCQLNDRICITGADIPAKPYDSESSCFEECKTRLRYDPNAPEGVQAFDGADTLNCRMFHLILALGDKATHCPHTAVSSATCRVR